MYPRASVPSGSRRTNTSTRQCTSRGAGGQFPVRRLLADGTHCYGFAPTSRLFRPVDAIETPPKPRQLAVEVLAVSALFGFLYAFTAAEHLLGGDAGLFATIYADGGHAHPPGYPLYSLVLRATSWWPVESPAHGAALSTAVLGGLAVGMTWMAARVWTGSRFAAAFAVVAFGAAPHVWLFHTQPEVFALNHLLCASIVAVSSPSFPIRGVWKCVALGTLAGLALSHHFTSVFLAPLGLYAFWISARETTGWKRPLTAGLTGLVLGLVPYSYLPFVATYGPGWHWGDAATWNGFSSIVSRSNYGTFQLTHGPADFPIWGRLRFFVFETFRDLRYVTPILALAGVVQAFRGRRDDATWPVGWLAISALLAGPVFAVLLPRRPAGVDYLHIRKFHLLAELLIVLLAAVGVEQFEKFLRHTASQTAVVSALVVASIPGVLSTLQTHQSPTVENYIRDTFRPLPKDAVVLGTGDHRFFGSLYHQRALDRRADVVYVDAILLALEWYHGRATERLGVDVEYTGEQIDLDAWFRAILDRDRPLFVTHPFHDGLLRGWASAPWGTAIRVYPSVAARPPPQRLFRRNHQLLKSGHLRPHPSAPPNSWAHFVLDDYAGRWDALAAALAGAGRSRAASRAREIAEEFHPDTD